MLDNLVIAIDLSEDGPRTIALVGIKEHILKAQDFSTIASTLKHYRELPSNRKRSYIKAFPRRYSRLYNCIETARVYMYSSSSIKTINTLLKLLNPVLVIVDDKIYNMIRYPKKIKESKAKRKHEEYIKKISDNLANYFRLLLKEAPSKFREELKRFEK